MDVYIVSYKKNGKWNSMVKHSKKRFTKLGYRVFLVEGYSLKEHPEIKPNQVCYLNIRDKVLPLIKNKNDEGFLVAEDDAYPNDFLTPSYLKRRLKKNNSRSTILRVGYQKKLKQKGEGYPLGYYLVGTQLIWFPKKSLNLLKNDMFKKQPQHLNGYLSKLNGIKIEILDEKIQKKKKYVYELEHTSTTTGKTRKGLRIIGKKTKKL